jgi:hypothetical protein
VPYVPQRGFGDHPAHERRCPFGRTWAASRAGPRSPAELTARRGTGARFGGDGSGAVGVAVEGGVGAALGVPEGEGRELGVGSGSTVGDGESLGVGDGLSETRASAGDASRMIAPASSAIKLRERGPKRPGTVADIAGGYRSMDSMDIRVDLPVYFLFTPAEASFARGPAGTPNVEGPIGAWPKTTS